MDEDAQNSRYWVKSVARAADILELLAAQPPGEKLSVTDIAAAVNMSKSSAFATLYTLGQYRLVADHGSGGSRRYQLGMSLARLGHAAASETSLRDAAHPHLLELVKQTGAVARLAIMESNHAVVIDQVGIAGANRNNLRMGSRELPHCTGLGKAILSSLSTEEAIRLIQTVGLPRRTPNTITDLDSLLAHLEEIRDAGYALDDEEDAEGVYCIGAAVYGHERACVGAISITGLKLNQPTWRYQELGRQVRDCSAAISRDFGFVA